MKLVRNFVLISLLFEALTYGQFAKAVSSTPAAVCSTNCVVTFPYTGDYYSWTVPSGIDSITVDAYGAQGGLSNYNSGSTAVAALGGRVQAKLTTTPGEVLYIYVGGQGSTAALTSNASSAGWNGGGKGGYGNASGWWGSGGGGATDIRTTTGVLSSRILVAGGGGGGGGNFGNANDNGGAGGGLTGANGAYVASGSVVAGGGTSSSGGVGNRWDTWGASQSGSLGLGGDAQATDNYSQSSYLNGGGGGGGGYYGGGGGSWVGGGGGSSYTHPTRASAVTHTQGSRSGNGLLTITYLAAPATISIATSGNVTTVKKGQAVVLNSNINYSGKIYFYADGKKIPGCTGMRVSSGTISCNWKPSNMKKVSIYASYIPTGAASETKSSIIFVNVIRRTGTR